MKWSKRDRIVITPEKMAHEVGDILQEARWPQYDMSVQFTVGSDSVYVHVELEGDVDDFPLPEWMYTGYRDTGYTLQLGSMLDQSPIKVYGMLMRWSGYAWGKDEL